MDLKISEVICDKCEGSGIIKFTEERGNGFYPMKVTCDKCKGDGKLDWIENITGKKEVDDNIEMPIRGQDMSKYLIWSDYLEDTPTDSHKKDWMTIQEKIDPHYKKKLYRRIQRGMQNTGR